VRAWALAPTPNFFLDSRARVFSLQSTPFQPLPSCFTRCVLFPPFPHAHPRSAEEITIGLVV